MVRFSILVESRLRPAPNTLNSFNSDGSDPTRKRTVDSDTRMSKCACDCGGRVQFRGCFKPGHQPVGTSRDPSGKIKASSDFWNPVNNPVNNAKVQKRAREEAEERIAQFSEFELPITEACAREKAQETMESVGETTTA